MLKVHVLYEYDSIGLPHGCSHIRLLRPLSHPSIIDRIVLSQGLSLPEESVDVVIVERSWCPGITMDIAQDLIASIRRMGAKFIYTLDDNLLDLHENAPWEVFPNTQQKMAFRYFAREADGLIVSTENLRKRFSTLNKNIITVSNALDERIFPSRRIAITSKPGDLIKIGYMGTRTHAADLLMIMTPLRKFLHKNRSRVTFEMVGVYSDKRLEQCFDGYPVDFIDVGNAVDYENFIPWAANNLKWDYALAPLQDNLFNQCKSDIKFLDYALLGIPGIFSNVASYRSTVIHQNTGWLCENSTVGWFEALEYLLDNTSSRQSMAHNAWEYAANNRTLAQCAIEWLQAVETIAAN